MRSKGKGRKKMSQFSQIRKKTAEVWKLISPYWRSEEKYRAWTMLAFIIFLNLGFVYISVLLNEWNAKFYNAIQQLDQATFISQCYRFAGLIIMIVAVYVANAFLTSLLGFQWRKWLTKYYLNRWMDQAMFYRLSLQRNKMDNPDQRIAQDLSSFSTGILTIGLSIFKEIVNLFSFIVILWSISGSLQILVPKLGKLGNINIPGYMVWLALIYAMMGTWGIFKIGRPLVHLDFNQERFEANFRYQLVRLREHSEEVALYQGEKPEASSFKQAFGSVYENFRKIINRNLYVHAWQNFYNNLSTVFPFLIAAPRFFSGALTLGILMQIASAFSRVEGSLSMIVLNFQSIASLFATTNRLLGFSSTMHGIESQIANPKEPCIQFLPNTADSLVLENIRLETPDKQILIEKLNLTIKKGEKVLIMGRSGLGKSTLLRAIAGFWSYGAGKIKLPVNHTLFLVPQRPYMPLGTLRQGLFYPGIERAIPEAKLLEILIACRLEHLASELDDHRDWSLQLSMGEQQRIIFARAILHASEWIIMDEPSASMDKETEMQVYLALHHYLPNSTVITIGHSPSLRAFHSRILELHPLENITDLVESRIVV